MNDLNAVKPDWAWAPFEPNASQPWNRRAAAHLYRRAGFGADSRQLDAAVKQGVEGAVTKLLYAGSSGLADAPAKPAAKGGFTMKADMMGGMVMAGGKPQALGA